MEVKGRKKLTLEEYVDFHEGRIHSDFTIKALNQVVAMHGFVKLHNRPKKDIIDALKAIELLPPLRSTLKESIASCAFLPLHEVIKDLTELGWNECPVQSIETFGSTFENDNDLRGILPDASASSNSFYFPPVKRKARSKRQRPKAFRKDNDISVSAVAAADDSGPLPSTWLSLGFS